VWLLAGLCLVLAFRGLVAAVKLAGLLLAWRRYDMRRRKRLKKLFGEGGMAKFDTETGRMLSGLRCPICSAGIRELTVEHGPEDGPHGSHVPPCARLLYKSVYLVCDNGCEVRTKGPGSEALYRTMQAWLKARKKMGLPKR
jgi:hypothetical protein